MDFWDKPIGSRSHIHMENAELEAPVTIKGSPLQKAVSQCDLLFGTPEEHPGLL